ncbi:MAG: phosphatase PAP2 family protein [Clostridia bacterium]|nr:phosphatase PAP2 family protein [Clostridia bacterium]
MNRQNYLKLYGFLRNNPMLLTATVWLNRVITALIYGFYPLFLFYLFWTKQKGWLCYLLIPFFSFVAVSLLRAAVNARRPYEKFAVEPLIDKQTKGHSFPSRHTFSIFIIGFCTLPFQPAIGTTVLCLGVLLAVSRVLLGVHFIHDVVAGALFAAGAYFIGFHFI